MEIEKRDAYAGRAQNVIDCLRNCNSAADIHKVANMRNVAGLVVEMLNCCSSVEEKDIEPVVKRLQKDVVDYFKTKFDSSGREL